METNLPMRVTLEIRAPGNCFASAIGSSMKSVLPRRTSRIVRPGKEARNPRTTVSTSGSSGTGESNYKYHNHRTRAALRSRPEFCSTSVKERTEKGMGRKQEAAQGLEKFLHGSRITSHESRKLDLRQR